MECRPDSLKLNCSGYFKIFAIAFGNDTNKLLEESIHNIIENIAFQINKKIARLFNCIDFSRGSL